MADNTSDEQQLERDRAEANENWETAKKDIPRHDRAAKIADAFEGSQRARNRRGGR